MFRRLVGNAFRPGPPANRSRPGARPKKPEPAILDKQAASYSVEVVEFRPRRALLICLHLVRIAQGMSAPVFFVLLSLGFGVSADAPVSPPVSFSGLLPLRE